ncbi:unnamed protein product [Amoebophrya sp. A25]|nr:unnamed protein product [Amoebophrya sp. A25]|eukprot:GSA25T00017161001.1
MGLLSELAHLGDLFARPFWCRSSSARPFWDYTTFWTTQPQNQQQQHSHEHAHPVSSRSNYSCSSATHSSTSSSFIETSAGAPPPPKTALRKRTKHELVASTSFVMRFYSHMDKAAATSTYTEGELGGDNWSADKALTLGSGYWCSSGKHALSDVVTYAGELKHRKKVSGVKVFWAYAPGKVSIRTSPDGVHWSTIIPFHSSPRAEVSYEQNLLFDKQRNVKMVALDMTTPRPWGFYGINQISLLR